MKQFDYPEAGVRPLPNEHCDSCPGLRSVKACLRCGLRLCAAHSECPECEVEGEFRYFDLRPKEEVK